jgi:hypothetical protein
LAVINDNLAWSLIIVGSAVFMFGVFLLAKALSESMALLKAELDAAKEQIDRAQEERSEIKRELATRHGNVPDAPPTAP